MSDQGKGKRPDEWPIWLTVAVIIAAYIAGEMASLLLKFFGLWPMR